MCSDAVDGAFIDRRLGILKGRRFNARETRALPLSEILAGKRNCRNGQGRV
ncbi:MAG: hypothetical protein U0M20_02275 [Christensenellales bacterium]|nr:hypothetical protein [Christensenellales bacterium]